MTSPPLPDPRPGPGKQAVAVQRMFDRVAPRYDVANTIFSLGQDRHWRRVAVRAAQPGPGDVVVDVAAGTGALAGELRAAGAERVVALDFSSAMLAAGAARRAGLLWCAGDALRLPFPDASVDVVTIAFGLRNLADVDAGLAEFARITRPGGRLVVLEFTQPSWPPFAGVYRRYLLRAIPRLATVVTSDPEAYRYLAESIAAWPDAPDLARQIARQGWGDVVHQRLTGGIVAVHRARRAAVVDRERGALG